MTHVLKCDDCHRNSPLLIMVKDHLWAFACSKPPELNKKRAVLCFQCIQVRLERQVTFDDLRPCQGTDELMLGAFIYTQSIVVPQFNTEDVGFHVAYHGEVE